MTSDIKEVTNFLCFERR